jgi:cell division protein FtsB
MESSKKRKIISFFIYLIIAIILIFSLILIWPVERKRKKMQSQVDALNEELARKTSDTIKLKTEVDGLENDPEAVEKVAREKFNLCKPGEVILKYDKKK